MQTKCAWYGQPFLNKILESLKNDRNLWNNIEAVWVIKKLFFFLISYNEFVAGSMHVTYELYYFIPWKT